MFLSCLSHPSPKDAFLLAVVSVIVTIFAALGGIILYQTTGSSLCLAYGLENLVDLFSSIIVMWRFFIPTKCPEALINKREHKASIAISFMLISLGIQLSAASIDDFVMSTGEEFVSTPATTTYDKTILTVSYVSVIIFGILTIIKFQYSFALNSLSLYKDGICSLIGTISATALFFNTLIVSNNSSLWWFDPTVALICGIGAFFYGSYAIYFAYLVEGTPLFSFQYWWETNDDQIEEEVVIEVKADDNINDIKRITDDNIESAIKRNENGTMA